MDPERLPRKLAAILHADVAGYSRLTGRDEDLTHLTLREHLDRLAAVAHGHGGQVVHYAGDAVLVRFAAAVDAVVCAEAVQRELAASNAALPEARRVRFRIGVNLGDVIEDRGDIYGDGVNVAARLESLAEPGGICISGTVYDAIGGRLPLPFEYTGEQWVKNIDRPVRVYRARLEAPHDAMPIPGSPPALEERPTIAVLPFHNTSGDPAQEYFADGLTEDIITALCLWRSFPVVARNSSFAYKGRSMDVRQVAAELGSRYVLEGGVRKRGDRLRITAELVDAGLGHHVWAQRFDRRLEDVFDIQDEIAQRIATTLVPELERAEYGRSVNKRTESLTAWDLYLQGMVAINELTPQGTARARECFQRAVDLDPRYCQAWAGLALSHERDLLLEVAQERAPVVEKAFAAARRAVALDESSYLAHLVLGTAYLWDNQHEAAIAETEHAHRLNPNDAYVCLALGNKLDVTGRSREGIPQLERALALNPQDPHVHMYMCFLARAYVNARRYEEALSWARRAAQRHPGYAQAHYMMAVCLGHLGRREEARAAVEACERAQPGFVARRASWQPYRDTAANEHIREGLRKAGLSS